MGYGRTVLSFFIIFCIFFFSLSYAAVSVSDTIRCLSFSSSFFSRLHIIWVNFPHRDVTSPPQASTSIYTTSLISAPNLSFIYSQRFSVSVCYRRPYKSINNFLHTPTYDSAHRHHNLKLPFFSSDISNAFQCFSAWPFIFAETQYLSTFSFINVHICASQP